MIPLSAQDVDVVKRSGGEVIKLLADPKDVDENYIFSYLIVGNEGRVLVETGPKGSFERLENSLKEKGFKLNEIDAIFLTHIHLDHAGGAGMVVERCNCPVYVHPKGLPHLADPSRLNEAAKRTLGEFVFNAYGPSVPVPKEKLVPTEDGMKYKIKDLEIEVIFTPGHAPHHQAILFEGVLFPGDALGEVTVWSGAYTPTTPHRTMPPMMVDSAMKLAFSDVNAVAYTHRGMIEGRQEALSQIVGSVEQLRTWIAVASIHTKECKLDVECYKKYLLEADPLYRKLVEDGELERSKLLQNSVRMSIDGIAKYVQGIK